MKFIQDESGDHFINIDQVESITNSDGKWLLKTKDTVFVITEYTMMKLIEWPLGYIYWSSSNSKENFYKEHKEI